MNVLCYFTHNMHHLIPVDDEAEATYVASERCHKNIGRFVKAYYRHCQYMRKTSMGKMFAVNDLSEVLPALEAYIEDMKPRWGVDDADVSLIWYMTEPPANKREMF